MTQPTDAWSDKDGLRWYTFQGKDYLSVTSMRKVLGMPYGLHNWTVNQYLNAAIENPGLLKPVTDDEEGRKKVRSGIRALGNAERDRAGERGTDVHAHIAAGRPVHEADPELQPYIQQYAKAVIALGIKPLLTERQVFNSTLGYAGSFDLLATLSKVEGHPLAVIDLKTGNNLYPEHALQGYSYLKAEFVAENDVVDDVATEIFKQATEVGILHLSPSDWAYHKVRLDEGLHKAWYSMCLLSRFLLLNPTIETLEVHA